VDGKLMGGKSRKETMRLPSSPLEAALNDIKQRDQKRAREVATFYHDLFKSISHVGKTLKVGGHACYVVGNRKVKGVTLPTDEAVRHFFEQFSFEYVNTFHRSIPNKRMPLRNSPTNAPGAVDSTMTREYIVVMRRR
jgi:DNA modification methylase